MKSKPFGIDIGTNTIKAVWFAEDEKQGYFLKAVAQAPTPPKGMMSESPLDQKDLAEAIRGVVNLGKISTQSVNIALPESQVYTRVLEMPLLSEKELASAMYWEAEQHIPVPLSTITLDWKVLPKQGTAASAEKMDVLLVGAPTNIIQKYQKIFALAGLEIVTIETEILSIVRALSYQKTATPMPSVIMVSIGAVTTSLAVVKNGGIVFTYSIPTGGIALSRAIAADFGVSLVQAEEYKRKFGITGEEGLKIGKATTPILMSIVSEIKKAAVFYQEKYKEEQQIHQIVLSGGTARLLGIDLFFAQNCNLETVIANPWKVIEGQKLPDEIVSSATSYCVAVGLAMRDYEQ